MRHETDLCHKHAGPSLDLVYTIHVVNSLNTIPTYLAIPQAFDCIPLAWTVELILN